MKRIIINVAGCLFVLYIHSSCQKEIKDISSLDNNTQINETAFVISDSLQSIYGIQSNLELLLADRIMIKDSVFVLDITLEEAKELNIEEETYLKFLERIKHLNKK